MSGSALAVLLLLGVACTSDARLLRRKSLKMFEPEEEGGFVGYQQMGVDENGRINGGGCLNWEETKMGDQGEDGIVKEKLSLEDCAKKCKETDGCVEFMHCSGKECAAMDTGDETGFCALAKKHCFVRPNMKHSWMTYRFLPDCDASLEMSDETSSYVCPLGELKNDLQAGYFRALHCTTINGNAIYHGVRDKSFAERWMRYYSKELECLFATWIDDTQEGGPCGGLPSQFEKRKVKWERICLSSGKAATDVFNLLSDDEKNYWFRIKKQMKSSEAFSTLLKLVGDKELLCMQTKLIDDECGAFRSPRMLAPGEVKKFLKPPRKEKAICKGLKFESADGGPCGTTEEEEEPHTGAP